MTFQIMLLATLTVLILLSCSTPPPSSSRLPEIPIEKKISAYESRHARVKPLIAVIGQNEFTETTDFIVPFGVLARSGLAEVTTVSLREGPIKMFPALTVVADETVGGFDRRFPEGADYVIVPAVHNADDPNLLAWVSAQAGKGATVVGICDGVWVLARAGLLRGHRATGHWLSLNELEKRYPETQWIRTSRYVPDGNVITTTGVTASIPVSLALVETLGGHDKAESLAGELGIVDWGPEHRTSDYQWEFRHFAAAGANWMAFWSHQDFVVPLENTVDEVSLALVSDAFSRTLGSNVTTSGNTGASIVSKNGLRILADTIGELPMTRTSLKAQISLKPLAALETSLGEIGQRFGKDTESFVALQLEYLPR